MHYKFSQSSISKKKMSILKKKQSLFFVHVQKIIIGIQNCNLCNNYCTSEVLKGGAMHWCHHVTPEAWAFAVFSLYVLPANFIHVYILVNLVVKDNTLLEPFFFLHLSGPCLRECFSFLLEGSFLPKLHGELVRHRKEDEGQERPAFWTDQGPSRGVYLLAPTTLLLTGYHIW